VHLALARELDGRYRSSMNVPSGLGISLVRRFAFGVAAVGSLVFSTPASGQQSQTDLNKSSQACAPVRIANSAGLSPAFSGESPNASLEVLVRLGYKQFFKNHQDAAAGVTLHQARAQATNSGSKCSEALSVFALGSIAENSSFKDAPQLFEIALQLFTELHSEEGLARTHFALGGVYVTQSKEAESNEQYLLAVKGFDRSGDIPSKLTAQLALTRRTDKDFSPIAAEAEERQLPCISARVHQFWADARYTANDYKGAMEHDERSDTLFAHCPESAASRAAVQTSMGRLERLQGRPKIALEHYKIALRLQKESGDLSYVPQTYNAMAIAYDHLDDLPDAVRANKAGLAVAQKIHSQPFIDFLNANLGSTFAEHGEFLKSIPLLENATRSVTSEHLLCVRLTQLGDAYAESGQEERGMETLRRGLSLCRKGQDAEETEKNLEDLAAAELKLNKFEDSLRDAREGLTLVEQRRSHLVQADAYKEGFIEENRTLYDEAIAALMALHRPAEALETAEQARSRAFLDLLGSHPVNRPEAEIAGQKSIHSFEKYKKGLIDSPTSVTPLTKDAMLETATRLDSTLLVYWCSPNALYIWVARPGHQVTGEIQRIPTKKLSQLVAATRSSKDIETRGQAQWSRLYNLLLAPIASALPQEKGSLLTIVPSGPLFELSFAALLSPDGKYVAERYRTHTIPSVSLLSFTQKNAAAATLNDPRFVFVYNPRRLPISGATPLSELAGTSVEVNSIAALIPSAQVTRLTGAQATPDALRASSYTATNLHFATHAVLDNGDPSASFLALDDTHHDGKLSVADIYSLNLRSKLVVLSACSTALGKTTGDGVAGMSRAFFYAGSASVLATLWDIADEPTAVLLPRFYAGLAAGQSASEALRAAQVSMLRDLRRHKIKASTLAGERVLPPDPLYWASFSLAGEP
jgi:CHAT domain-containing protein